MDTHIVIMAGGIGSRLWPASTPELPKQFIDVLGVGKSLIRLTVERFLPICPMANFWVVTSEKYVDIVKEQISEIPADHILAEPQARNTAPCIAYACSKIALRHPDANVVVTPSDALVVDKEMFVSHISAALDFTRVHEAIVTVGITPLRPETGYGYIHTDNARSGEICKVMEFKEKPCLEIARKYLADGGYYWNAGIFVWNVKTINSQLRRFAPQIMGIMDRLSKYYYTEEEPAALAELFPLCDKISIDYAVMEKSDDIYMISSNPGWSDLGSWGSVREHIIRDENGNAVVGGDVRLFGCRNCVVHTNEEQTVVVEGLDGYIVAEKGRNLLVCRLSEEQHIKDFIADNRKLF